MEQESGQILFSWLIGHLFTVSPHSQDQATKKSAAPFYRRETEQSKAHSSAVLLIPINDLYLPPKLVPERLLALSGEQMRTNKGVSLSGEVMGAPFPVLAPHIHLIQVFPVFCKFSLAAPLQPLETWRSKGV